MHSGCDKCLAECFISKNVTIVKVLNAWCDFYKYFPIMLEMTYNCLSCNKFFVTEYYPYMCCLFVCLFEFMFNAESHHVGTFSCSTYSNEDDVCCSTLYNQLDSNLFQYFIVYFAPCRYCFCFNLCLFLSVFLI